MEGVKNKIGININLLRIHRLYLPSAAAWEQRKQIAIRLKGKCLEVSPYTSSNAVTDYLLNTVKEKLYDPSI